MRVKDLSAQTELLDSDVLLVDNGTNGTKKILVSNFIANNAGAHNSVYRGKSLGGSVTADQWAEIKAGTFRGLYIGDYWTINSIDWIIAHFDKSYGLGDTAFNTHHITVIPRTTLYYAQMNTTDTSSGGYYNSAMKQTNLAQALTTAKTAFGEAHIATHRVLLDNAPNGGTVTGWAWYDSQIDLMTEEEVYGCQEWGNNTGNSAYCSGINYGRLALFTLAPQMACNRGWYWLRTVDGSTSFCVVDDNGYAGYSSASGSGGVRPRLELIG